MTGEDHHQKKVTPDAYNSAQFSLGTQHKWIDTTQGIGKTAHQVMLMLFAKRRENSITHGRAGLTLRTILPFLAKTKEAKREEELSQKKKERGVDTAKKRERGKIATQRSPPKGGTEDSAPRKKGPDVQRLFLINKEA